MRTQLWASGGGVQSAAIAALIVRGELKPDLSIIVDTEREQSTTWAYMDRVITPALASVGVTLHRVKKSDYATVDLYGGADKDSLLLPVFTTQGGDVGKLPTYCSNEWKRRVVQRWAKQKKQELKNNGVDVVLKKPFRVDEILRLVQDWMVERDDKGNAPR